MIINRLLDPLKLLVSTPLYLSEIVMHPIIFIKIFYPFILLPLIIFYFKSSPILTYIIALQIYSIFYPIAALLRKSFHQEILDIRDIIIYLITLLCYMSFYFVRESILLIILVYIIYYNIIYYYIYHHTKDKKIFLKFLESNLLFMVVSMMGYFVLKMI